jgi:hypothetical protein
LEEGWGDYPVEERNREGLRLSKRWCPSWAKIFDRNYKYYNQGKNRKLKNSKPETAK